MLLRGCFSLLALLSISPGCAGSEVDAQATSAEETDVSQDAGKADGGELRVRAGNMTVWIDRAVKVRVIDGEPVATISGRASRNLSVAFSFIPDDAFGVTTLISARRFEVRLRGGHEINSIFSGLPLLIGLEATGNTTLHTVRVDLTPTFTRFEGNGDVFVVAPSDAIYIGREESDPLRYRTHVRTDSAALSLANAGAPTVMQSGDGFDVLMSYADLEAAWRAGTKVTFETDAGETKRAALEGRTTQIAMTTADPYEVWPAQTCDLETYNCLLENQGIDVAGCGTYREVARCAVADICEVTDAAPLVLSPIDLTFAWRTQADAYVADCDNGGAWCSLGTIASFMVPECLAEEPTLAEIVAQTAAMTNDQDFVVGAFADGTVLDRASLRATPTFSSLHSSGGPALFDAIDGHMGGGEVQGWTFVEEVPCHNCTEFRTKLMLWYPDPFRVVAIEGGHGFD